MMTRTTTMVLVLAALHTLSACGPGTCIDPSQLTYRIQRGDAPIRQGEQATIQLVVVNRSDKFMLVEGVRGDHLAPGSADALVGSSAGSLEPDGTGGFNHNLVAQQETEPVFGWGLIPPGQKLPIKIDIVPNKPNGIFAVRYWGLSPSDAARFLLFPEVKSTINREHFVAWDVEDLEMASGPADDGSRSPLSTVVILGPELAREPPSCSVEMPYKLSLDE